ncbi:hypothetical protein VNO80_21585 [Phaseolus coccineus]|uniref:Uncharacterized protein n=1 Tax=Phaseolus coccineus TaxID=3886 RepID=A0AAN9QXV1_PHACN
METTEFHYRLNVEARNQIKPDYYNSFSSVQNPSNGDASESTNDKAQWPEAYASIEQSEVQFNNVNHGFDKNNTKQKRYNPEHGGYKNHLN